MRVLLCAVNQPTMRYGDANLNSGLCCRPVVLELGRRQIAQRGVDARVLVDVIEEATELLIGIMIVLIRRQVNVLFLRPRGTRCALSALHSRSATPDQYLSY